MTVLLGCNITKSGLFAIQAVHFAESDLLLPITCCHAM